MPSSAIFDASVVLRWMVQDTLTPAALRASQAYQAIAPTLLGSEVANALRTQVRHGRHELEWCITQLRRLPSLVAMRNEQPLLPLALRLAAERDHAVYDCVYIALAIETSRPLITADGRLVRKFQGLPGLEMMTLESL